MHGYFRMVSAVISGILILFLVLFAGIYLKWGGGPSVEKGSILHQPISGGLLEYPVGGHTSGLFASGEQTLHSIEENLQKAAVDKRITAVLITLNMSHAGFAALDEIRGRIQTVRSAGKTVWAWSDNFGIKDLYVASACDSFFIHPESYSQVTGLYLEGIYLAGALEKLGIEPELARIESYKSAAEMLIRKDMSPEAREMLTWIGADMYPRIIKTISEGRGMDPDDFEAVLEQVLPLPQDLADRGVVDGVRYWDEMRDALPRKDGRDEPVFVGATEYAEIEPEKVGLKGKKKIAVVHAQGLIAGTRSGRDPVLGVVMGHRSVNRDLKKALDDKDVVGIVFRVDSRGGSSLTSERISRMVEVVNRKKPVVVSMVDVAASGGYTVSYRARSIVAGRNTLTGSIGSITGKMNFKKLYNRLGITKDGLGIGPHGDFYSDYRAWTPEEYRRVVEEHWDGYSAWIDRIASHRNLTPAEVDSVARGRVWTGAQALDRKLVDRLGGLDVAIRTVKEAVGLPEDEAVTLWHLPKPEGFLATILGTEVSAVPGQVLSRWVESGLTGLQTVRRADFQLMEVPVP